MIQSSHWFDLAGSSPNFSESSLARRSAVLGFASAHPRTVRAPYASPHSLLAKLDSDKFGDSRRTKPGGLMESRTQGVGAPPQTPDTMGSGIGSHQRGLGRSPTSVAAWFHISHAKLTPV